MFVLTERLYSIYKLKSKKYGLTLIKRFLSGLDHHSRKWLVCLDFPNHVFCELLTSLKENFYCCIHFKPGGFHQLNEAPYNHTNIF